MNSKVKKTGIVIAAAAAAAFAMAPVVSAVAASKHDVKCFGVNACKGKSSCKTAKSMCKGHNACKGKGFVMVSKKACNQMGGSAQEK